MNLYKLSLFFFLNILFFPFFANATTEKNPLQSYRDEIRNIEANASQDVLNQLKFNDSANELQRGLSSNANLDPSRRIHSTDSSKKAPFFSPLTPENNHGATTYNKPPTNNNNNNPWLKSNPWEEQAKINPWKNAPIPTANNGSVTRPLQSPLSLKQEAGPPNIFSLPGASSNVPKDTAKDDDCTNH